MINIDIQELKRLYYDEQKSCYAIAQTLSGWCRQVIYNAT